MGIPVLSGTFQTILILSLAASWTVVASHGGSGYRKFAGNPGPDGRRFIRSPANQLQAQTNQPYPSYQHAGSSYQPATSYQATSSYHQPAYQPATSYQASSSYHQPAYQPTPSYQNTNAYTPASTYQSGADSYSPITLGYLRGDETSTQIPYLRAPIRSNTFPGAALPFGNTPSADTDTMRVSQGQPTPGAPPTNNAQAPSIQGNTAANWVGMNNPNNKPAQMTPNSGTISQTASAPSLSAQVNPTSNVDSRAMGPQQPGNMPGTPPVLGPGGTSGPAPSNRTSPAAQPVLPPSNQQPTIDLRSNTEESFAPQGSVGLGRPDGSRQQPAPPARPPQPNVNAGNMSSSFQQQSTRQFNQMLATNASAIMNSNQQPRPLQITPGRQVLDPSKPPTQSTTPNLLGQQNANVSPVAGVNQALTGGSHRPAIGKNSQIPGRVGGAENTGQAVQVKTVCSPATVDPGRPKDSASPAAPNRSQNLYSPTSQQRNNPPGPGLNANVLAQERQNTSAVSAHISSPSPAQAQSNVRQQNPLQQSQIPPGSCNQQTSAPAQSNNGAEQQISAGTRKQTTSLSQSQTSGSSSQPGNNMSPMNQGRQSLPQGSAQQQSSTSGRDPVGLSQNGQVSSSASQQQSAGSSSRPQKYTPPSYFEVPKYSHPNWKDDYFTRQQQSPTANSALGPQSGGSTPPQDPQIADSVTAGNMPGGTPNRVGQQGAATAIARAPMRITNCQTAATNCVADSYVRCFGDEMHIHLRFRRPFTGKMYIWNRYDSCLLHDTPPGTSGHLAILLRLNKVTICPEYPGYFEQPRTPPQFPSNQTQSFRGPPGARKFRIMIQFDPALVSREDINFVAFCDPVASMGPSELSFQYTVIDDRPVQLRGTAESRQFEVIIREGFSPASPVVQNPVPVGSLLLIQILALMKDPRLTLQAASCDATDRNPNNQTTVESGRVVSNPVELIRDGCSVRPNIMDSFRQLVERTREPQQACASTAAKMQAFKFPTSDVVVIRCRVNVCVGRCPGARNCQNSIQDAFADRRVAAPGGTQQNMPQLRRRRRIRRADGMESAVPEGYIVDSFVAEIEYKSHPVLKIEA